MGNLVAKAKPVAVIALCHKLLARLSRLCSGGERWRCAICACLRSAASY